MHVLCMQLNTGNKKPWPTGHASHYLYEALARVPAGALLPAAYPIAPTRLQSGVCLLEQCHHICLLVQLCDLVRSLLISVLGLLVSITAGAGKTHPRITVSMPQTAMQDCK